MLEILISILLIFQINLVVFAYKVNEKVVKDSKFEMLMKNLSLIASLKEDDLRNSKQSVLEDKDQIVELQKISSVPILKDDILELVLRAEAAVALDSDSDAVLFNKNADKTMRVASLTKLMTALVVLEKSNFGDIVTVSSNAVNTEGDFGDLRVGEQLTVKDMMHIMLLESSNDAAVALAEHIAGNVDNFIVLMNEKSKDLNLKNTVFSCPTGLDDENNVSTAYDIAQLADYSLYNDELWNILRIPEETVYSIDGLNVHYIKNTNKLLHTSVDLLGGKTGYTYEAGRCLILAGKNPLNGKKIISVVLNSNDHFEEDRKLLDWIYSSYIW